LDLFLKIAFGTKAMKAFHTTQVKIRPAANKDIDKMAEFVEKLLITWEARATRRDAENVYSHVLDNPDLGVILVAEVPDGAGQPAICAFAYASYEWRSEFGGEVMELVEMYVEQFARSAGVGRTLLNALIVHGRERGVHRFSCQVHPGNAAIERTLESCGLDPERRTVWSLNF